MGSGKRDRDQARVQQNEGVPPRRESSLIQGDYPKELTALMVRNLGGKLGEEDSLVVARSFDSCILWGALNAQAVLAEHGIDYKNLLATKSASVLEHFRK